MYDAQHIYGFDIETDNSNGHGLDPRKAAVTQIALVTADTTLVLEGDERTILADFDAALADLPSGLLTSWNGSHFDTPYCDDRAKLYPDLTWGLELIPQPGLKPKYDYLPGHTTGYAALWHRDHGTGTSADPIRVGTPHAHLDVATAYQGFAASHGQHPADHPKAGKPVVPWSLKPVAIAAGIDMVEIDRTALHTYSDEQVRAYVASDAHGTRQLALRLLGLTDA